MAVVTMRQLLEAGVHFGHQTRRWNPKMRRYILGERNGIYLIDLRKTLEGIDAAYAYVRDLVADGGNVLFVGTKKQTQGPVADYATACGMPYVNQRWLGGMLTNFTTVSGRVKHAGVRGHAGGRRLRRHAQEGGPPPRPRAGEAQPQPGRDQRTWTAFPTPSSSSTRRRSTSPSPRPTSSKLPVVAVVDTNCDPDVITT